MRPATLEPAHGGALVARRRTQAVPGKGKDRRQVPPCAGLCLVRPARRTPGHIRRSTRGTTAHMTLSRSLWAFPAFLDPVRELLPSPRELPGVLDGRSGWCWHGADLDKQPQHVGLGEALDAPVATEMQNGDAGQRDRCPGRGHPHELIDVAACHGEPDGARVAVPQDFVELQLWRVESAEDSLVETTDLDFVHRLRGIAVQADSLVIQRQVPVQVTGVPPVNRGGQGFLRCRHDSP